MGKLRQKMIRAMELKNLSANTQRTYLTSVTGIAKHYQKSPEKLSKVMIEDYLLYLKNDKGKCPNTCASALSGLRFFYNHVTKKKISIDYSLSRKVRNLPTVLPQEDIWSIIKATDNLKHRLILMTTYSAGLRTCEVTALKPKHIESKKMLIKVQKGKGGKSRYTLLELGKMRIELKLIVLFQVIFVLQSFYKVPREQIVAGLTDLLKYKGINIKEKKNVQRALELWREEKVEIVDCYLVACIEKDAQNILYSYDRDFDKFKINRKEP